MRLCKYFFIRTFFSSD